MKHVSNDKGKLSPVEKRGWDRLWTFLLCQQSFVYLRCVSIPPCKSVGLPWWCIQSSSRHLLRCRLDSNSDPVEASRTVDLTRERKNKLIQFRGNFTSCPVFGISVQSFLHYLAYFAFKINIIFLPFSPLHDPLDPGFSWI